MKSQTLSLKLIINELVFQRKSVIIQWNGGKKKRFVVACKQIYSKKIPHSRNSKEHYQSFIRKKNAKSVRQ